MKTKRPELPTLIVAPTHRCAMEAAQMLKLGPRDYIIADERGYRMEGMRIERVVYVNGARAGRETRHLIEMCSIRLGREIPEEVINT